MHDKLDKARKNLGIIRKKAFKSSRAYWYCKLLNENHNIIINNPGLRVEWHNYMEAVQWIKEECNNFPWIYNSKEIEYAERYKHFYPTLKYNNNIIGYLKIALRRAYIEDYEDYIILEDDESFICDTFIHPEYRGKHLGSFMLGSIFNELRLSGISLVFCHIPGWNLRSSNLYKNMGFIRISHVKYLRLLKFRYFSKKPDIVKMKGRNLVASLTSTI